MGQAFRSFIKLLLRRTLVLLGSDGAFTEAGIEASDVGHKTNIGKAVYPNYETTYSLVSITDANLYIGTGNNGTPIVSVTNPPIWYHDADGDTYYESTIVSCVSPGADYTTTGGSLGDCDDQDATKHASFNYYRDSDGDGYGAGILISVCSADAGTSPAGYSSNNTDCNDYDASIHSLNTYYQDNDGDGYGSLINAEFCLSTAPVGYSNRTGDCNDNNAAGYPGATEVCDGIDNNCDGQIDEDFPLVTYYFDVDGDGYGSPNNPIQARCFQPINTVTNNLDCDDQNASVHPGAPELCDGIDNDCDGQIDEDFPLITFYFDVDGDGYGNPNSPIQARCIVPAGTVSNNLDCDDNNDAVHPGATELCDGIDNNCDGNVDEGCTIVTATPQGASMTEGNSGKRDMVFTVSLSTPATQNCSVDYKTIAVTATKSVDYKKTRGTLSFVPGETSKTVTVKIIGDTQVEPDETFRLKLYNAVNLGISPVRSTGTIINDDAAVAIAATGTSNNATLYQITTFKISPNPATSNLYVQLSGYTGNVTLQLRDLEGKLLRQQKLQVGQAKTAQQKMDVAALASGIYLLTVIDEKGNIKTEKVIISR